MTHEEQGSNGAEDGFEEEELPRDAALLPDIPEHLNIDPLLAALLHAAAFLDVSGDETVDHPAAGEVLRAIGSQVQRLADAQLNEIQAQLERIEEHGAEAGWPEDILEFVQDFLYACGVGDDEEEDED